MKGTTQTHWLHQLPTTKKVSAPRINLTRSEAVYGCTQGPRLETAAEIKRMQNDGCDVVGMTAMPEAALAREIGMEYAGLSLVVNWAAGVKTGISSIDEITKTVEAGMRRLKLCLPSLVRSLI